MKNAFKISLFLTLISLVILSCNKTDNDSNSGSIIYQSIDKEYVLIRDVKTLRESSDLISSHIDSILTGLINTEFVSTGQKSFDLNADMIPDIGFEIIDLNKFNPNGLPESFDSLAARVIPLSVEILDNSTYGYPDALSFNDQISESGYWSKRTSVLGTFANAGQFQGHGEKYLGFRFPGASSYQYGWIQLYCSRHNDTLKIIDFAYKSVEGGKIYAGQKK